MSWRAEVSLHRQEFGLQVTLEGGVRPVAVVGPNGAGKSTLLRILAGAVTPSSGHVEVAGRVLFSAADGIDLPTERRQLGYVPQGYGLFDHMSVVDNVAFGLSVQGVAKGEATSRAGAMLAELGIGDLGARRPRKLSGGERQRVALARALILSPSLLLLDEPLAALDATARRSVRSFLAEHIAQSNCPTILVTHDVRDLLAVDCDIVVLDAGRVAQRGTLEDLRRSPESDFVAEFVAAAN